MNPSLTDIIHCFGLPGEILQEAMIDDIVSGSANGCKVFIALWNGQHSVSVQRWAIRGLGKYRSPEVSEILLKAMEHRAMTIRLHAIHAVRESGDRALGAALLRLVDDPSGGIRMNVLDAIVSMKITGYEKILQRYVHDSKPYIVKRAQYYLNTATA